MAQFYGTGRVTAQGRGSKILDLKFSNDDGLRLSGTQDVQVSFCEFENNGDAIDISGNQDNPEISENTFYNSGAMIQGNTSQMEWGEIHDNVAFVDEGIVDVEAYRVRIYNNTIVVPSEAGISLTDTGGEGTHTVVAGNTVDGGWIRVEAVTGTRAGVDIHDNTVLEPGDTAGITLVDCSRGLVHHNTVVGLDVGSDVDGIVLSGSCADNLVDHNQVVAMLGIFGGTMRYGINTSAATGGGNRVVGNDLGLNADYATGALSLAAGDTDVYPGGTYGDNWA